MILIQARSLIKCIISRNLEKAIKMTELKKDLKIALVHDFLTQYGGAERVLEVFCEMFPKAPIYTLLYDKVAMRGKFKDREIHTSFLQKFPKFLRKKKKWLLPLMPTAPETFNLRDFDLIISSCGVWSKAIITRLDVKHICYMHSPMRFAWEEGEEYLLEQKRSAKTNFFVRLLLNYLRVWDRVSADRPDYLIANSRFTRERIKKYYNRESVVIYPPVNMEHETRNIEQQNPLVAPSLAKPDKSQTIRQPADKIQNSKFFLVVSRLSPYKKIDAAVEAFNKLELPLIVIGEGSQEKYLRSIAGKNVKILGWQPEEKIREYYAGARAFIFAGVDDFGMTMVEALARGVPVLALKKGGALEIVAEGKTGEFFVSNKPEIIAECVKRFMEKEKEYDKNLIIESAKKFSKERFVREFEEYMAKILNDKF
ncbi:MAG: glycosyltransferase family 4 protein [Candidatus Moranbacteria bacterium CG_4_9_14_3_um_filter_40_7]|nr:MAG: glycosyl transferase [Candidatus Moranbacteria bacterium CG23_combo_of_CG06-09_8_20_14_all_40_16]PIU80391.1 MAG: glycosyltransferase family 4 protein [Candidatus Moranbacteria bacterium CG06_land_8_20_14_3_00_40_12]PJA87331.1 MAG: glycosyltransferase family 4 protein [Candidatus Moranbacteria bacterium CG_4_9_14_3_um_filter_40_7]